MKSKFDKDDYIKIKKQLSKSLKNLQEQTSLDFKFVWGKSSNSKYPSQLYIYWNNNNINIKEKTLLNKVYFEEYQNLLLNEKFQKKDRGELTLTMWKNDKTSLSDKIDSYITAFNFIHNKNINKLSNEVLSKYNVKADYLNNFKHIYIKKHPGGNEKKFKSWFKENRTSYKKEREYYFKVLLKKNLLFNIKDESTFINELFKFEKILFA
ncbi:MAG: hypothetical protein JKY54_00800 [Flavobacteriales bacterium]|nr:hypothetical protein [Flavobacteriales bacterium]